MCLCQGQNLNVSGRVTVVMVELPWDKAICECVHFCGENELRLDVQVP